MEINEAKQLLIDNVKNRKLSQRKQEVIIFNAMDKVLAEDIIAPFSVPNFPKSAMDGYCVKAEDIAGATKESPATLKVVDEIMAGDYKKIEYKKNTAIRVMTGGYVPEGYDAVVKQEDTDYGEDSVKIYKSIKPYSNYCMVGEDINANELVIKRGTILNRCHIGMLASLGLSKVVVMDSLKVGILSTGSELITPGEDRVDGKIYNNISYMLKAQLFKNDIQVDDRIVGDDIVKLQELMLEMLESNDILITTGGVSVGKKDLLPKALDNIGAKKIFQGVNIKPGTPTIASIKDEKIILSLSGNPYAALANFDFYFWDLAAALSFNKNLKTKKAVAIMGEDYTNIENKTRLVRASNKDGIVLLTSNNASSVISNMVCCNCYIIIEANRTYKKGDKVNIFYIK